MSFFIFCSSQSSTPSLASSPSSTHSPSSTPSLSRTAKKSSKSSLTSPLIMFLCALSSSHAHAPTSAPASSLTCVYAKTLPETSGQSFLHILEQFDSSASLLSLFDCLSSLFYSFTPSIHPSSDTPFKPLFHRSSQSAPTTPKPTTSSLMLVGCSSKVALYSLPSILSLL